MNKLMKLLDNCGETIKKIAGFCFLFYIVIAVGYFALGVLNILSAFFSLLEYHITISEILDELSDLLIGMSNFSVLELIFEVDGELKDLFVGILLCISSVFSIFTSILSLPLYGFGCIIEDIRNIRENTEKNISDKE